jgi:hypothetical protein
MRTSGTDLTTAFTGSYQLITYADAWYGGDQTADNLPVVGGSIEYDLDSDQRSTLKLTVASSDGALVPLLATDPLAPYGQEINISMALVASGQAQTDPISIGWFRIQEPDATQKWLRRSSGAWRSGGAKIELTALDRMAILADARFLTADQPQAGATVLGEIARLVSDLVPMGDIDAGVDDKAVNSSIVYTEDRVAAIRSLAASTGTIPFIDSDGALRVHLPTAYGATPVATLTVGAGGVIGDYATAMTRDGVCNVVIATGEASGDLAPVQGIAYDLDPNSPTCFGGPFGSVPMFYSSPLLTTQAMAEAAAKTLLNSSRRGREREIVFSIIPNFLLELDDPVLVVLPDRTIAGRIVKMTLPLTPGAMSVTIRALDTSITGS